MASWGRTIGLLVVFAMMAALPAVAQENPPAGGKEPGTKEAGKEAGKEDGRATGTKDDKSAGTAVTAQAGEDEDLALDRAEPDFTIITLPTTLRLPRHKGAFRITHRFSRPLGEGSFGELAEDLFGFDSSAGVGLEYRFGLMRGTQVGIFRHNGKTIQFLGQHNFLKQSEETPVGLDGLVTVEGFDNFKENYAAALGAVVSRKLGERSAVYVEPIWVANSNPAPDELVDDNHTLMLGLGARVGVSSSLYLVAQVTPRVAGYDPETTHASFGLEGRVGGHAFQLNFSNSFAVTMAEVARGGFKKRRGEPRFWFIGFNITRKFF